MGRLRTSPSLRPSIATSLAVNGLSAVIARGPTGRPQGRVARLFRRWSGLKSRNPTVLARWRDRDGAQLLSNLAAWQRLTRALGRIGRSLRRITSASQSPATRPQSQRGRPSRNEKCGCSVISREALQHQRRADQQAYEKVRACWPDNSTARRATQTGCHVTRASQGCATICRLIVSVRFPSPKRQRALRLKASLLTRRGLCLALAN